ncbi:MAG: motility associated factor glycosyltransferase family protein [Lachnospiraceae bacterium]|nr:motility associated factor glycosyltransferase family protein [Lachnospiraceae bacterium]
MDTLYLISGLYTCCDRYSYYARLQDDTSAFESLQNFTVGIKALVESDKINDEDKQCIVRYLAMIYEAQKSEDRLLIGDIFEGMFRPKLGELITGLYGATDFQEVFEENLAYNLKRLEAIDRNLYIQISSTESNGCYTPEISNSGCFTCSASDEKGKYYLCGNINPRFEGALLAEKYFRPVTETYIIYGFGLGYHCEALANMCDDSDIEIYEDDMDMIRVAFCANKLDWLWNHEHVRLIYDKDFSLFSGRMQKTGRISTASDEILFIHHPSIRHIKNGSIKEYMERLFVSDHSLRRQEGYMYANYCRNIKNCRHDVARLKSDFEKKDAIIVAGGPSLDLNIDLLRKKKTDMLIIAVGTVFHKLMDLKIVPDFVIVSDASPIIARQFEGWFDCDVPLLMLSTACKGVAVRYTGEKYLLCQEDYPEAEKLAKEEGLMIFASGGSVSTTALDVCIRMGCKSISFVGLDLAYTKGKTHTLNTIQAQQMDTEDLIPQRGYEWVFEDGKAEIVYKDVFTSRNLGMYNEWISNRIGKDDVTMPVCDATEGGAVIEGLRIVRLSEILC